MKIQRLAWAGIKIQEGKTTLFVDATSKEGDIKLTAETEYKHAVITNPFSQHFDPAALKTVFDNNSWVISHEDVLNWVDTRAFHTRKLNLYESLILAGNTSDLIATAVPAVSGFGPPL